MNLFNVFVAASVGIVVAFSQQTAAQEDPAPIQSVWLRQIFSSPPDTSAGSQIILAGRGSVTVYLNGQRLVRNHTIDNEPLSWDVETLLRPGGNNCISVALTSDKDAPLGVWISSDDKDRQTLTRWKATNDTPPVGWQQTDFNDRDWITSKIASPAVPETTSKLAWAAASGKSRFDEGKFEFRDGDHVLLFGGTLIERAQQFGHLECALNGNPKIGVTFRNLGWSGDTVFADSRGIFDTPEKGYERMIEHVRAEEPSVVLLCYGQNEAMTLPVGAASLNQFRDGLRKLYADVATTGAEIVFVSPHPFVPMSAPLPDPTRWNDRLLQYSKAVEAVAVDVGAPFIDLFSDFFRNMARVHGLVQSTRLLPEGYDLQPKLFSGLNTLWTDNGIHWNDDGYQAVATVLADRLNAKASALPTISVVPSKRTVTATGGDIRNVEWNADPGIVVKLEFRAACVSLFTPQIVLPTSVPVYGVGFGPSDKSVPSEAVGISMVFDGKERHAEYRPAINHQYERLKELVVKKNELYFYRWRPQNITYLYGFRKHEQGNNASEIARFDPLIEDLEQQIQKAKSPAWQTVTVTRTD